MPGTYFPRFWLPKGKLGSACRLVAVHCQIGNDMLSGVWMVFHDASGTAWVIVAKDAGQSVGREERVWLLSLKKVADETGLVALVGATYPSGCGRCGTALYRGCGPAGVVCRVRPPRRAPRGWRRAHDHRRRDGRFRPGPGQHAGCLPGNRQRRRFRMPGPGATAAHRPGQQRRVRGTAIVTGLGAGPGRPFTVRVTAGGPGATVLLTVSGLSFHEILTDGHFDVS